MAKRKTEEKLKVYFVERDNGLDQKITVPESWKVTFGPLVPGSRAHESSGKPVLRFYESPERQRACITNVVSFRECGIPIEEKRTSVKQQTLRKDTKHGSRDVVVEGRVEEWVNPDAPNSTMASPDFFRLEHRDGPSPSKEDF